MNQSVAKARWEQVEPMKGLVAGLLGGLAGTVMLSGALGLWSRASAALARADGTATDWNEEDERSPERQREEGGRRQEDGSPTVQVAQWLSRGLAGRELPRGLEPLAGQVVHFGFGSIMGGVYGVLAEHAPEIATGQGMPAGAALWLSADLIALPVLGLSPPPTRAPASTHAGALLAHLVYGRTAEAIRRQVRPRL